MRLYMKRKLCKSRGRYQSILFDDIDMIEGSMAHSIQRVEGWCSTGWFKLVPIFTFMGTFIGKSISSIDSKSSKENSEILFRVFGDCTPTVSTSF